MGPTGPAGRTGPAGPQGPQGPAQAAGYIDFPLTAAAYGSDGTVFISDRRIDPRSFDGLYLKGIVNGEAIYMPLEYLLMYGLGLLPGAAGELPTVVVGEGAILILDPERGLLTVTIATDSVLSIKLRS